MVAMVGGVAFLQLVSRTRKKIFVVVIVEHHDRYYAQCNSVTIELEICMKQDVNMKNIVLMRFRYTDGVLTRSDFGFFIFVCERIFTIN